MADRYNYNLDINSQAEIQRAIAEEKSRAPATSLQLVVRGLGIGFAATQVLDVVSTLLYEKQNAENRLAEDQVRGGHQAYEVAVARLAKKFGRELSEDEIKYWGWKFHRSFGMLGGLQYLLLRRALPKIGFGLGLGFGLAFFLFADELMIYVAGLTPGPTRFSWKAHARGAVAHIAYGVVAELTARSFEMITPYEEGTGFGREEDKGRGSPYAPVIGAPTFA
jgi:hypothetical protein